MSKIDNFPYPLIFRAKIWWCSLWSRSVLLGSTERGNVRLSTVKLFSKNSNPGPLYFNVTDRETDRHYHPSLAACGLEKFREGTPTSREVIGSHPLISRPNFKFSRSKLFGELPSQFGCALARLGQSLARVKNRAQHPGVEI